MRIADCYGSRQKHDTMVYFFSPQMHSKTKYKGHVQRGIGMNYDFIFFMELGGINRPSTKTKILRWNRRMLMTYGPIPQ